MRQPTLFNKIKSIRLNIAGVDMTHHIKGQGRHQVTCCLKCWMILSQKTSLSGLLMSLLRNYSLIHLASSALMQNKPGGQDTPPATMLKLYIYGYLNRIQSSRRLEKEAHSNVELMWLLERLTPDFKTIADFR